ncbi:Uncharacterized protein Fot_29263 [Forsythia ovata]|uniref:Uncharacterized protein n=1 Tax=Forsythia ovata TaxID=205694 RepID=A0ABD1TRD3_9LAMI
MAVFTLFPKKGRKWSMCRLRIMDVSQGMLPNSSFSFPIELLNVFTQWLRETYFLHVVSIRAVTVAIFVFILFEGIFWTDLVGRDEAFNGFAMLARHASSKSYIFCRRLSYS